MNEKATRSSGFSCDMCSKVFKSKDLLRQHMHCHRTELYLCPYCHERFKWKKYIPIHIRKRCPKAPWNRM